MDALSKIIAETVAKLRVEGGKALGGDRIAQADVIPTIEKFKQEVLSQLPVTRVEILGSAGKKETSGDLDLGIETTMSLEELARAIGNTGYEFRMFKGLDQVSVLYPQHTADGRKLPRWTQIDLVLGEGDYLKWSHASAPQEKGGVMIRALVGGIIKVATNKSVNITKGVFDRSHPVGYKKTDKDYSRDLKGLAGQISAKSAEPWTVEDMTLPPEQIWEKVKRSFKPEEVAQIADYFKEFMGNQKIPVPSWLGEARAPGQGKVTNWVGSNRGGQVGQGNIGGPRNRGRPGYPVPDSLKPGEGDGGLETLDEVADPGDLEFGIKHLDDLKPDEFMQFLKKFASMELEGGLEVSEKVDGSARLSFGPGNGHIWTQTKTGSRKAMSSQYPDNDMFRPIKAAHAALEEKSKDIINQWPEGVTFMVAEVLYTRVPNTIEYGDNTLIIHGVHSAEGVMGDAQSKRAAMQVIQAAGGQVGDFKLEYKRTLTAKDVMVDVKHEYETLGQLHKDLASKPRDKQTQAAFKQVQLQVKKKLLSQLHRQKSAYGPEGGDVEGLVFRDLESGAMVKLVDKDYFTKLNDFMWKWRKRIGKEVFQGFQEVVAKQVLGDPGLQGTRLVTKLLSARDPKDTAGSPEQQADRLIARYITKNNLMTGDFQTSFQRALMGAFRDLEKIKKEYGERGEEKFDYNNPEAGVQKTRTPGPEVQSRTEESIKGAEANLAGIRAGMEQAGTITDPLTQKVALFKLFLGYKFQRLVEKLGTQDLQEAGPIDRGTGWTDLSGAPRIDDVGLDDAERKNRLEEIIEQQWKLIKEAANQSTVGATVGRFQPFHAGHAEIIRKLASQYSKVLIFVAGQKVGKDNPFSYDLRLKMMEGSLQDVWSKVRVFPATIQGKGTGYVPGLIANVANAEGIAEQQPVTVLVGEDRIAAVKQQVEHNSQHQGEPGYYTGPIEVQVLPGVKNDDDTARISGTRVREAIASGDKANVRRMLDPRLSTDSAKFEELFVQMSQELKANQPQPKKSKLQAMVERIMSELGMGGLETGKGFTKGGGSGTSAWSRGTIMGQEDGEELYQQMQRSPSTRMLPMDNHGQPNSDLPGVNAIDGENQEDQLRDPTDLKEIVNTIMEELGESHTPLTMYGNGQTPVPVGQWIEWSSLEGWDPEKNALIVNGKELQWSSGKRPGESWVAYAIGGKQTGNATYDIAVGNDKYEVKEPTTAYEVRLSTDALERTSEFTSRAASLINEIWTFYTQSKTQGGVDQADLDKLNSYADVIRNYKTGNLNREDKKKAYELLQFLKQLKTGESGEEYETPWLQTGRVTAAQAAKVSRALGIPLASGQPETSAETKSYLEHPYIDNPDSFISDFDSAMEPMNVLSELTGVVLVNRQSGMFIVPREMFKNTFYWDGAMHWRPKLRAREETLGKGKAPKPVSPEAQKKRDAETHRKAKENQEMEDFKKWFAKEYDFDPAGFPKTPEAMKKWKEEEESNLTTHGEKIPWKKQAPTDPQQQMLFPPKKGPEQIPLFNRQRVAGIPRRPAPKAAKPAAPKAAPKPKKPVDPNAPKRSHHKKKVPGA